MKIIAPYTHTVKWEHTVNEKMSVSSVLILLLSKLKQIPIC